MCGRLLSVLGVVVALTVPGVADELLPPSDQKPPYERLLTGDDAARAEELQKQIAVAEEADRYDDAIKQYEELLALRTQAQGADHWETVNETWILDRARTVAALAPEQRAGWRNAWFGSRETRRLEAAGQFHEAESRKRDLSRRCEEVFGTRHPDTAMSYNNLASNLDDQGRHREAEPLYRKALEVRRELLGEVHPATATTYNNLAFNLQAQGRFRDAQPLYHTALKLRRELFGNEHSSIAGSLGNLAANLMDQGQYGDALPLFQESLRLNLKLFGEDHPQTATSYNNVAFNLASQGRNATAQPLYLRALQLRRELLGEGHAETAASFNNLAANLDQQGKYADAEPLYRRALEIYLDLFGEQHPQTAGGLNNLAYNLDLQDRPAEAEPLYRKALDINRKLLGQQHSHTASSCNNLAANLMEQGRHAEAQVLYDEALRLRRGLLGEKHPHTAQSYLNTGINLIDQRRHDEARRQFHQARDLYHELLGKNHADFAAASTHLGLCLIAQGRQSEAIPELTSAASAYEAARWNVAGPGLDRAIFGAEKSPYRLLAAAHARLGASKEAWHAAEMNLARGMNDEAVSRHRIVDSDLELSRQVELGDRLSILQADTLRLVTARSPDAEEIQELDRLRHERLALDNELAELVARSSLRLLARLDQVQAALPDDAALVLWVDASGGGVEEHWGCVVRHTGEPHWELSTGTGPERAWTAGDSNLPKLIASSVGSGAPASEIGDATNELYSQRLKPLEQHLRGVKRLWVVPSDVMAGVPIELLTRQYVVSYVPSGTFLTRNKFGGHRAGHTSLVVGDPAYPATNSTDGLEVPPGGLLIRHVGANSAGAQAQLRAGDVLLKYAGERINSLEQLDELMRGHLQDESIPCAIWRQGQTLERQVLSGPLGLVIERQPAPEAMAMWRKDIQALASATRSGHWSELPGTSVEVARLKTLIGDDHTTALTRSDASEQALEQLRAAGKLKDFRYLHFATHGEPNNARAFESALILAQDQITGEIPTGGGKYFDGRLTANEVLENWELNADLVTLSACESALGRPGGGDGLLGFAQAFLLAGARSVCLSLWKVDDTATALLMDRFYQNLLGNRDGLEQPMPKADALAEAKQWLRSLALDEATQLAADLSQGVARGKNEPALALTVLPPDAQPSADKDNRPFGHPRSWAAFILIGDPD